MFQSTPLREGRPQNNIACLQQRRFNPRPCGRGDVQGFSEPSVTCVSIHAPAGGATLWSSCEDPAPMSFNPRPCGRGDNIGVFWGLMFIKFQSTPLREGRLINFSGPGGEATVSIHAPAGGATVEGDFTSATQIMFQSTPLREGRPPSPVTPSTRPRFNPRPCGRGDDRS